MTGRNLAAWLSYFEEGSKGRVHLGLERVRQAAERLELIPLPYLHVVVGGTNGKGSTSTSLACLLQAAGYRVGLYTSPHLFRYNERIVVQQKEATDEDLCAAFAFIDEVCADIFLSYFEVGFLACLIIFKEAGVNAAVFEVGLGGRLDAVNITEPDVSVITTVDFDHMAFLGNSLEEIAYEKSGIMRSGKPCIYGGDHVPGVLLERAEYLGSPLWIFKKDFVMRETVAGKQFQYRDIVIDGLNHPSMHPSNVACVVMAMICLVPRIVLDPEVIKSVFNTIQVKGRYYRAMLTCPWIFDVAHNVQAVRYLMERLNREKILGKRIAIFCCMADKNMQGMMLEFCPHIDEVYFVPLSLTRAASTQTLHSVFDVGREYYPQTRSFVCASVQEAIDQILQRVELRDCVVVFGSFYLLEAVFQGPYLKNRLNSEK